MEKWFSHCHKPFFVGQYRISENITICLTKAKKAHFPLLSCIVLPKYFVQNKTRIGNLGSINTYSSAGVERSFLRKPETRFSLMRRARLAAVGRVGLRGVSTC